MKKNVFAFAYRHKQKLLRLVPRPILRRAKRMMLTKKNFCAEHRMPFRRHAYPDGVNLIGSMQAETGLGQSARLLASMLQAAAVPQAVINYEALTGAIHDPESYQGNIDNQFLYNVNLVHINPHELSVAFAFFEKKCFDEHYNIGFWLWELEEFPEKWVPFLAYFDEIWTPSEFISNGIRKWTEKPVLTMPYAIEGKLYRDEMVGLGTGELRAQFGIPEDCFVFLTMYDVNSVQERKNPEAVIEAFCKAFSPTDKVMLVLKVGSADKKALGRLKRRLEAYPHIMLFTERLSRERVNRLITCVDVVVSLHRAEGFGLVMAEAMALGTPVIATDWSANTEFMDETCACMVKYDLTELKRSYGPFEKGARWADVDTSDAAAAMLRLYKDRDFYERIRAEAIKRVETELGMAGNSRRICDRLKEIWGSSE